MSTLATKSELSAVVYGKEYTQIPDDLFIPPDALEVLLESFSGPLDLLLYLIRKQNIDILDIPIMSITKQYLQYIGFLFESKDYKLELAADYLLMATVLAEIKSKLLLPIRVDKDEETDIDPRMDLVRRLQAYEEMKQAALELDCLPRRERDTFLVYLSSSDVTLVKNHPDVNLMDLIDAMKTLLQKEDCFVHHEISRENLSVRDRMCKILLQLQAQEHLELKQLFSVHEGRAGLIVAFLAILELARQELISISQTQPFSIIYIRAL
ncbi:MAG: segregation/condensation protein A [Legionella sp.]|nr:segregation/condensation protein A [Legionella sp.]